MKNRQRQKDRLSDIDELIYCLSLLLCSELTHALWWCFHNYHGISCRFIPVCMYTSDDYLHKASPRPGWPAYLPLFKVCKAVGCVDSTNIAIINAYKSEVGKQIERAMKPGISAANQDTKCQRDISCISIKADEGGGICYMHSYYQLCNIIYTICTISIAFIVSFLYRYIFL